MTDKYIIQREDELVRRVPKYLSNFFQNNRPTSAAFKTKPEEDGLSVNILKLTTIEETIQDNERFVGAVFTASIPIDAGYDCLHAPDLENNNLAHALIVGDTKKIAKKLSLMCRIEPPLIIKGS